MPGAVPSRTNECPIPDISAADRPSRIVHEPIATRQPMGCRCRTAGEQGVSRGDTDDEMLGTAASGMILPVSNAMTGPVASYLAEPSIGGRTAKLCRGSVACHGHGTG